MNNNYYKYKCQYNKNQIPVGSINFNGKDYSLEGNNDSECLSSKCNTCIEKYECTLKIYASNSCKSQFKGSTENILKTGVTTIIFWGIIFILIIIVIIIGCCCYKKKYKK
ncbi:hypothetical protein H8356DRAFT_1322889 [Neocallimastix lanati (nom. inval.)]|nr:hypothetical protein H8356DRAFT_1322889 [Neocallimastix sp. JGI-2020a]